MRTRQELIDLASPPGDCTCREYFSYLSVKSRGLPYYGKLKKSYPYHASSYARMFQHAGRTLKIDPIFTKDPAGLIEFILYMGDVPSGMAHPTRGRINHDKGYERGNFHWQEKSENSKECAERNKQSLVRNSASPTHKMRTNLENYLQNNLGRIHVTHSLSSSLGYKYKKDMLAALRGLGRDYFTTYKDKSVC